MNKYQEALKKLCDGCEYNPIIGECSFKCPAKEELKELVEKATPKKPSNETFEIEGRHKGFWNSTYGYYHTIDDIRCPHCFKRLKVNKAKHCDKCGGALDWSEEDVD